MMFPASPRRPRSARANTLLIVMLTIAVLSLVASNLLWSASARYHTTYQSASWQEALVAAEGGVNLAMAELRTRVRNGQSAAFKAPWIGGNPSLPPGPGVLQPADKRLLGGAIDPTTTGFIYDAVNDPGASHPVSLTPAYPETGHALPVTALATHGGEGNTRMWARVYVDVPGSPPPPGTTGTNFAAKPPNSVDDFMNEQNDTLGYDARTYWWYRIRSVGVTGISGPPRPSVDGRDNLLRRISFFTDWRSNRPVDANGPQVSRIIEAVARPQTGFRNALMADVRIDLANQSVLIDSYNSTYGLYGTNYTQNGQTFTNVGTMGNIATNGTLINAGGAVVQGNAMTDDGSVQNANNVSGNKTSDFYQELSPVAPPQAGTGTTFTLDGKTLNGSPGPGASGAITFDGAGNYTIATSANRDVPTRVYVNGIDLTNGPGKVELKGAADNSSTYVKLIVNGNVSVNSPQTNGANAIVLDPGVHAIIYVTGNVSLQGAGIMNTSQSAGNLLINGVSPPAGSATVPTINVTSTQDFQGIIYAPGHDLTMALQAVPAGGGSSAPTGNAAQIANLQKQIADANKNVADLQNKYDKDAGQGKDSGQGDNSGPGGKDAAKASADLTQLNAAQSQLASLQSQLQMLTSAVNTASANDHANGYNGIYGAFVAHTIVVGSKTHVHYDEALRQAGPVNHYTIANWFEDNASHSPN